MAIDPRTYAMWIERFDTLTDTDLAGARRLLDSLARRPSFDVVMPVYDPPEAFLEGAIRSVREQLYPSWNLCIRDDGSSLPHVRRILEQAKEEDPRICVSFAAANQGMVEATNAAIALGRGELVVFLDHDDLLAPHALLMIAHRLQDAPDARIVHVDGDMLDGAEQRMQPWFKPDYDHDLLLGFNAIWGGAFRRDLLESVGGMRAGFTGSQDFDLSLRAAEAATESMILHVPHVLYHWRMVPSSFSHTRLATSVQSAWKAVTEHCERTGVRVAVSGAPNTLALNRVRALMDRQPSLTLVVELGPDHDATSPGARFEHETEYPGLVVRTSGGRGEGTPTARRNVALREVSTDLIAFVDARFHPRRADWAVEMASHFAWERCAGVGARVIGPDATVEQSGVVLGVRERAGTLPVARALHGQPEAELGGCARAVLAHGSSALAGAPLVFRTEALRALGGFEERFHEMCAAELDLTLRARGRGWKLVTCPHAVFDTSTAGGWFEDREGVGLLVERWGDQLETDPFYNPNLTSSATDFGLAFPPRVILPWRLP